MLLEEAREIEKACLDYLNINGGPLVLRVQGLRGFTNVMHKTYHQRHQRLLNVKLKTAAI